MLELLVVLTIVGLILGVSGLALGSLKTPVEFEQLRDLKKARADAIESGAPRTAHGVLFLPDGRAIGAGVDPFTGAPVAK